jgi:hypothetical protein
MGHRISGMPRLGRLGRLGLMGQHELRQVGLAAP